jgi:hypothetical protein
MEGKTPFPEAAGKIVDIHDGGPVLQAAPEQRRRSPGEKRSSIPLKQA